MRLGFVSYETNLFTFNNLSINYGKDYRCFKKAERRQAVIKLALQGPSGSGKTYSSLLLAYGLAGSWNQIAPIDTDNNSYHLYSHPCKFDVLSLSEPFTPKRYPKLLKYAGRQVLKS